MTASAGYAAEDFETRRREAVSIAVDRLAATRHPDGSFGTGPVYRGNVGVTAIAALALMSDGHVTRFDRHGDTVAAAVRYVVDSARPDGMLLREDAASPGPMFEHGYAVRLLAEADGTIAAGEPGRLRRVLVAGVRLIERARSPSGGWRYLPGSGDADVTVTACVLLALRAAAGADVEVDAGAVAAGETYLGRCLEADGGYRYRAEVAGPSGYARSAIATAATLAIDGPGGREREVAYLLDALRAGRAFEYDLFGHWHAAEAARVLGGTRGETLRRLVVERVLASRRAGGTWGDANVGDDYATATAVLALTAGDGVLPAIPPGPLTPGGDDLGNR